MLEVLGFLVDTEATHEHREMGHCHDDLSSRSCWSLENTLTILFIVKKRKTLAACSKTILPGSTEGVEGLVEVLLNVAYEGAVFDTTCRWAGAEMNLEYTRHQANKRQKVFTNLLSGGRRSTKLVLLPEQGDPSSASIWYTTLLRNAVRPILDYVTRPGSNPLVSPQNAGRYTLARPHHYAQGDHQGNLLDYDTGIAVSSDGLAHDISNGFAEHEDPRARFATLLGPTGNVSACWDPR